MISLHRGQQRPSDDFSLAQDEVHVWCVSLPEWAMHLGRLQTSLSPEEASRAARFYRRVDRENFVIRRGLLREILGCYLNTVPSWLRFSYGPHGKPAVAAACGDQRISFNLSHSRGLALYALTVARAVGVDVEYVRDVPEYEQVASRLFSAQENRALGALPPSQRRAAFFRVWTRKEAYIKAIGLGLAQPLDQFDVSVGPDEPPRLVSMQGDPTAADHFSLHDLRPASDCAAALAVEGRGGRVISRLWPGPTRMLDVSELTCTRIPRSP